MQKINFQNLPNTTTPVNASNLNQLQTNIENEFYSSMNNNGSISTVEGLVDVLITAMTHKGLYNFASSWSNHSFGYTAICQRAYYNSTNDAYSGIIFEYANSHVYTFTKRTTENVKIKTLA